MKVYFKTQQFELLKRYCEIDISSIVLSEKGNKVSINGDKQYFENLLAIVSDVLTDKGLNEDSEPNKLGFQIEEIIDILSEIVYN